MWASKPSLQPSALMQLKSGVVTEAGFQQTTSNDDVLSSDGSPEKPLPMILTAQQVNALDRNLQGMRSISNIPFHKQSAIASVENVMVKYPLPPKKGAKKVEEKKGTAPPEPKVIPPESNEVALGKAISWSNASSIQNKFSVGMLTTAKYHEKVSVFERMNVKAGVSVALQPPQAYYGKTPDPDKDPYDRRKVK
jgi:hypothetical protein